MGMANVNLEDAPDGTVNVRYVHVGGFNPNSHAHQQALLVQKILDVLLEQLEPVQVIPMTPEELSIHKIAAEVREKVVKEGLTDPLAGLKTKGLA